MILEALKQTFLTNYGSAKNLMHVFQNLKIKHYFDVNKCQYVATVNANDATLVVYFLTTYSSTSHTLVK